MEQLKPIVIELRQIDRALGNLADLPALKNAPLYVRQHLTECRDRLMKESQKLDRLTS